MIRIYLSQRLYDGTGNINVVFNTDGEHVDGRLLEWLSLSDVWNYTACIYNELETFELPRSMKTFLYSDSFKFFVMKFHRLCTFKIIRDTDKGAAVE